MSGLPIKTNLDYYDGDSFSGVEVIWQDADGEPIDLTDFLASLQVKDSDGVEVLHLDSDESDGEGGLEIEAEDGKVVVNANAQQMASGSLVAGEIYNYDIQVKSEDGSTVRTLMFGKFSVHEQVTEV